MGKHSRKKTDAGVRRKFFAANLSDLLSKVLRMNRLDAAKTLEVDYGWLRKACSVGLTQPNSKSPQLNKVAEFFELPVKELWTPKLLARIWAGAHLPELRLSLIRRFNLDQFVEASPEFEEEAREVKVRAVVGESADLSTAALESLHRETDEVTDAINKCANVIENEEFEIDVLKLYGLYKRLDDELRNIRKFEAVWGWENLSRAVERYEKMRRSIFEELVRKSKRQGGDVAQSAEEAE